MMRQILVIICLMLTTACGFTLRGNIKLPEHLKSVRITSDKKSGNNNLVKKLRKALVKNGANVITHDNSNVSLIKVTNPKLTETKLATGQSGNSQVWNIKLEVSYKVYNAEKELLAEKTIHKTNNIHIKSNATISTDQEKSLIKEELLDACIIELLQQITR